MMNATENTVAVEMMDLGDDVALDAALEAWSVKLSARVARASRLDSEASDLLTSTIYRRNLRRVGL